MDNNGIRSIILRIEQIEAQRTDYQTKAEV